MTDPRLERLALRLLEGEAVDWNAAEAGDERLLANLRVVADIGSTLRRQASDEEAGALVRHLHETWSELASSQSLSLSPGDRWGRLVIRELLGAGASAEVYRAWDDALQREVALKLFRSDKPQIQERMLDEGRRLARIDHPNVVRVHGADRHDGRVGLWMELIEGETLARRVQRERLGDEETAALGRTLCDALAAVHAAGLVHGDIKAQNVIRAGNGRLVLTDFGSSAEWARDGATPAVSGTPLYLAPELLAGEPPSPRSDVYGLGVLLFHLLTGSFPVVADSLAELREAHRKGDRRLLADCRPGLDPRLAGAIEQSMAADPAHRFDTAGRFAQALAGSEQTPKRTGTPRPGWWLAGALLLLLAGWWVLREPAYTLDARLFRLPGETPGARLESGASVRVGDRLSLELVADRPLHVWIFNEDQAGNAFGLFPIAELGQANPLAGGQQHVLPGGDGQLAWVIDRPGGVERLHIVTSPEPRPDLDALFHDLPPLAAGPGVFSSRGIGSVQRVDAAPPRSAAPLLQAIEATGSGSIDAAGLHHQVFELPHAE